jgi:hypothetical protein
LNLRDCGILRVFHGVSFEMKQNCACNDAVGKILYEIAGWVVPGLEGFRPQASAVPDSHNLDCLRIGQFPVFYDAWISTP